MGEPIHSEKGHTYITHTYTERKSATQSATLHSGLVRSPASSETEFLSPNPITQTQQTETLNVVCVTPLYPSGG